MSRRAVRERRGGLLADRRGLDGEAGRLSQAQAGDEQGAVCPALGRVARENGREAAGTARVPHQHRHRAPAGGDRSRTDLRWDSGAAVGQHRRDGGGVRDRPGAKLGARVTMVTRVGRDVFGEGTLRNYREQGIDTTYLRFDDERFSGVAPIFVDDSAQNVIVIIPGANLGLSLADVQDAAPALRAADVVVCQLEVPVETTLEAFRIAKSADVRTILNPAPAAPLPDELLRLTDLCVPNEPEVETLTGLAVKTGEEVEAADRALRLRGPHAVIIT